jgi:hypothetical protein
MSNSVFGSFTVVWVDYCCSNGHRLLFGHGVTRKWKFTSGSPAVCLSCGTPYTYAELKFPDDYFTNRRTGGTERQKAVYA